MVEIAELPDLVDALDDDQSEAEADEADEGTSKRILPLYRRISGRYKSCANPWELTLRVDFDGVRPKRRLSGDYFRKSGSTMAYFGSFIVDAAAIRVSSDAALR